MSFKDIKGQDSAVSFLKAALANGKIAHAYIFLGPEGVGRKKAAIDFAKALNCITRESDNGPCDRCASCRKIDSSNHPDVFLLEPEGKGELIKMERVHELINNIALKPYEGRKKVYIIDGADSMRGDVANALLKTLEEPPSESVMILIVERLENIFSTIISRSQVVRFFSLKTEATGEVLDRRNAIIDNLIRGSFFDIDFEGLSKDESRVSLDIMLTWYRDILLAKAGLTEGRAFVNIDKYDAIMDASKDISEEDLEDIIKAIIMTNSFLDRNVNMKLAMSVLGLKILKKDERGYVRSRSD